MTTEVRFADLVDEQPESMTCGRRMHDMGPWGRTEGLDRWQKFKSNGNRVCSFCGSLHPDDLFAIVRECGDADETAPYGSVPEIEQTDKSYKIYVHQPGVKNAHDGGIKFYMHHLPRNPDGTLAVSQAHNEEYSRAIKASKKRFTAMLNAKRGA